MKQITYAIHAEGFVVSRVRDELLWPILDFEGMTPENNFETVYNWEKIPLLDARYDWQNLTWTKKIVMTTKNFHRAHWGMKPLRKKGAWQVKYEETGKAPRIWDKAIY